MTNGNERYVGLVERWNDERGFGSVRIDGDSGPSVYVHAKNVRQSGRVTLHAGEVVEFFVAESDRGPRCIDVVLLDPAAT